MDYRPFVASDLSVRLQGRAPWISAHRLSVAEMVEPLARLVHAYRWTANAILQEATEEVATRGRLRKPAARLDLEMSQVTKDCVDLSFVCVQRPVRNEPIDMFATLHDSALERMLDALDKESRGIECNIAVRRYLHALPEDVDRHVYVGRRDGQIVREVVIETRPEPVSTKSKGPRTVCVVGRLVEVGLEPSHAFVKIRPEGDKAIRFESTVELVEAALALRQETLCAIALVTETSSRLLRLDAASGPQGLAPDERMKSIVQDWGELLRRLA
jgi:hypothetical protein